MSAADLGIVLLRPQVWLNGWGNQTIECSRDYATGLLAQAKLGHRKKRRKGYATLWQGPVRPLRRESQPSRRARAPVSFRSWITTVQAFRGTEATYHIRYLFAYWDLG